MELLAYISLGLPYGFAAVLGLLIPLILLQAYRSAGFGIALMALLFVVEIFFPGQPLFRLGILLYVPDFFSLTLGLAALLRFLFLRAARPPVPAWYLYVLVMFISLGWGLATLGSLAGVGARPYFYGAVAASYMLTFPGDAKMVRSLVKALAVLAIVLVLVVAWRWIVTYLPIPSMLPSSGRFASVEASLLRVVPSQEALVVGQVVVLALFFAAISPTLSGIRPLMPLMFLVVVALQHRSVWLTILAAVATRFALPQAGRKATAQLAALALVLVVVAVPLALSGKVGGAATDVARSANRAVELSDTASARIGGWKAILKKWAGSGPASLAVGLPMGTSMERSLVDEQRGGYIHVAFQAHNYFVQTIFNMGILGVGAAIAFYAWVLLSLYRGLHDRELADSAAAMLLLTVMQMIYYLTYGVHFAQAMILGVAASVAVTLNARRRDSVASTAAPAAAKRFRHPVKLGWR